MDATWIYIKCKHLVWKIYKSVTGSKKIMANKRIGLHLDSSLVFASLPHLFAAHSSQTHFDVSVFCPPVSLSYFLSPPSRPHYLLLSQPAVTLIKFTALTCPRDVMLNPRQCAIGLTGSRESSGRSHTLLKMPLCLKRSGGKPARVKTLSISWWGQKSGMSSASKILYHCVRVKCYMTSFIKYLCRLFMSQTQKAKTRYIWF